MTHQDINFSKFRDGFISQMFDDNCVGQISSDNKNLNTSLQFAFFKKDCLNKLTLSSVVC